MKKRLFDFIRENKYIIFILLLGLILRFFLLSQNPPSLNWDEVSHGYNAYSILKTGKDEWGISYPTVFRAYGDYKLPVYIYLAAISEAIFGLSAFSVRLPSIVAGMVTVLFTYLLAKKLFGKRVGIISSLLVAIEPWSLFLSRGAFEANVCLTLIVSGVYFFIEAKENPKKLVLSSLLLGLSIWTYNSARVFIPLLLVTLVFVFRKDFTEVYKKAKTNVYMAIVITLLFFIPMFWQLLNPAGLARYSWVTIIDEGAIAQINQDRITSDLSPFFSRLVHNKVTYLAPRFIVNYISHFSPKYLFLKGGSHYQFNIPDAGLIYPINGLFILFGLYFLVKKRTKETLFVLIWLLLAPIASSLTREAPHTLRSITILPLPMVITAIGIEGLLRKFNLSSKTKTTNFFIVYSVVIFIYSFFYLNNYFTKYRKDYSWAWQYGYKEAVSYIRTNYDKYDKIIITKKYGEPHEFLLFYWPWDPKSYQEDKNLIRFGQSDWYWVDRFDKFYFVNDWEIPRTQNEDFVLESGGTVHCSPTTKHCLLITSPGNVSEGWKKLKTINFLNNKPAFEVYDNI